MTSIGIFSNSKPNIDECYKNITSLFIELLCKNSNNKFIFYYGGGNSGLMGIIAETCIKNNNSIIGVNCNRWKCDIDNRLNRCYYYDGIIERQNKLIELCEGYIILPGGVGSMYELFQVLTLNDVGEKNNPIFMLNINNYFKLLIEFIEECRRHGTIIKSNEKLKLYIVDDYVELVKVIIEYYK